MNRLSTGISLILGREEPGKGGDGGKGAGGGGGGGNPPWTSTFPTIAANAELSGRLSKAYKSPEEALSAFGTAFGPDWREAYAKDDTGKLNVLQRFADPFKALDSMFSGRQALQESDRAKPLPEKPTDQELSAYRTLHGIPEKPEGYFKDGLPDGLVIGEMDKPVFDKFAEVLHKLNATPATAHGIAKWYYDFVQGEVAAEQEMDAGHSQETEDALRKNWGNDYRQNENVIRTYMDGMPKTLKDAIEGARDASGRGLMNNPEFKDWMVKQAREIIDVSTIIDAGGGDKVMQTLDTQIAEFQTLMRTNRPEYNRREGEYRALLDKKQKLQNRQQGRAA